MKGIYITGCKQTLFRNHLNGYIKIACNTQIYIQGRIQDFKLGISPIIHFFFFVQLLQASGNKLKTKYHTFPKFCRKTVGRSNVKSIHWHINTWPVRHFDNKRWSQTSFMDSGLLCLLRISISLIGIWIVNCRWCAMI